MAADLVDKTELLGRPACDGALCPYRIDDEVGAVQEIVAQDPRVNPAQVNLALPLCSLFHMPRMGAEQQL